MAKVIKSFNIDKSNLSISGETRSFTVSGDSGAVFSLEITNEDSPKKYYNFTTGLFQTDKTKLDNQVIYGNTFTGSISFPSVGDPDKYDIYLWAEQGTKHAPYQEVRFANDELDINSCIGSSSLLLQKVIYQTSNVTFSIGAISPTTVSTFTGISVVEHDIVMPIGKKTGKIPFSILVSGGSTHSLKIDRQPKNSDIGAYVARTIGASAVEIDGEDIWTRTARNTDTTNATMSSTDLVTMTTNVADKMKPGDRVTGTGISSSDVVTVLNITDGTVKQFRASQNVSISSGVTLTFTEPEYFRWTIDNIDGITSGSVVTGTNIESGTLTGSYEDSLTIMPNTPREQKIVNFNIPVTDSLGVKPSLSRSASTYLVTKTQTGNIVFNKQQPLELAGDGVKIYSYKPSGIKSLTGWDIELSDLKVELIKPTTTVTAAVYDSLTVNVASGDGIMDDVSTVSGIGINPYYPNPKVTNIGSYSGGTATLTLSRKQTLENGTTLTFDKAARTVMISGNIKINKSDQIRSDWLGKITFALENFLTATDES